MDERHAEMWQVAAGPEDVLHAIYSSPPWTHDARRFATMQPDNT
jgi:hypothetical protein